MLTQLFKSITFWLALAGLAILAGLVNATTGKPPQPPALAPPAEKPWQQGIGASGIVESMRENTQVGVSLPGLVRELPVKVWDEVRQGDVLLQLDDRELRARLITQEAELALREAELAKARGQHARLAKLSSAALAREELDQRADEIPVAEAAAAQAAAAIRQTQALLELYVIRAPLSGTIL